MSIDGVQRARRQTIDSEPAAQASRPSRPPAPGVQATPGSRVLAGAATRQRADASSGAEVRARLDAFRASVGGPYRLGGAELWVDPPFRMQGGLNQQSAGRYVQKIERALSPAAWKSVSSDVGLVIVGKGTPDQIRRVTQALVDSPAFAAYPKTEAGIRQLMWDHGVGMDCSGYVHHAFLASRAARGSAGYGLGRADTSGVQSLGRNPAFRSVPPSQARSGDIIVLKAPRDDVGHKVIVFDRATAAPGSDLHAAIARQLRSRPDAKIQILQVDSSWGANGKWNEGGVRRSVWAFDESTGRWATLTARDRGNYHVIESAAPGPYGHELEGVYRPRAER